MLNLTREVHPLSDFQRNTSEFLDQLQKSGQPVVLTIDGNERLVVQDAAAYQKLLALAERSDTIHAVKECLAAVDKGEGRSSDEVFDNLEAEIQQVPPKKKRQLGTMKGSILYMVPDFDAPLDDFREYMD